MESKKENLCVVSASLSLGIASGILAHSVGKSDPEFAQSAGFVLSCCDVLLVTGLLEETGEAGCAVPLIAAAGIAILSNTYPEAYRPIFYLHALAIGLGVGGYLGNCINNHINKKKSDGGKERSPSDLLRALPLAIAGAVLGIQYKLECDITAAANAAKLQTERDRQAAEQRVEENRQQALQWENDYQTNILVPGVRQLTRHFRASADILNQELRSDQAAITERQRRMDQDGKTLRSELPLEARGELLERLTAWDNNFSEEFREVPRPVTSLDFLSSAEASNWLNTNGKYDFSSLSPNGPTRLDFSDANTVNEQVITVLPEIIRRVGDKLPKADAANLNQAVDAWRKADSKYANFQQQVALPYQRRVDKLLIGLGG